MRPSGTKWERSKRPFLAIPKLGVAGSNPAEGALLVSRDIPDDLNASAFSESPPGLVVLGEVEGRRGRSSPSSVTPGRQAPVERP